MWQKCLTTKTLHIWKCLFALFQTLLELTDQLESLQKDKYIIDTSVGQIRDVMLERESKRGRVFYENEPIQRQSITMLVHSIERAFQDADYDVTQRQDKIDQVCSKFFPSKYVINSF